MNHATLVYHAPLTCRDIWQHFQNIRTDNESESNYRTFFDWQDSWMRDMIEQHPTDPFWRQAGYIVQQLDGIFRAYGLVAYEHPSWVCVQ